MRRHVPRKDALLSLFDAVITTYKNIRDITTAHVLLAGAVVDAMRQLRQHIKGRCFHAQRVYCPLCQECQDIAGTQLVLLFARDQQGIGEMALPLERASTLRTRSAEG